MKALNSLKDLKKEIPQVIFLTTLIDCVIGLLSTIVVKKILGYNVRQG